MGEWREGRMEGMGTLYYPSGSLAYHGNWRNDQFNGKGTVYNESPTKITGEFNFSNFDTLSEYWIKYEGTQIKSNQINQLIKFNLKSSIISRMTELITLFALFAYLGDFVDDNKEGLGSIFLSNGDRFVGSFKNDFVHGKG